MNQLSSAQRDAVNRLVRRQADETVKRLQWIMFLAISDEFGIGKKRLFRLLDRYSRYCQEYGEEKRIDAADDILTLRIRQRKWADIYEI